MGRKCELITGHYKQIWNHVFDPNDFCEHRVIDMQQMASKAKPQAVLKLTSRVRSNRNSRQVVCEDLSINGATAIRECILK